MAPVMVELRGQFVDRFNNPMSGTVRFVPSVRGVSTVDNVLVPTSPETVQLDSNGEFSIFLQATDDPNYLPIDWTYRVESVVGNVSQRPYSILIPAAAVGTGLDLADITPVPSSPGNYVLVTGPTGPAGPAGPAGPEGPEGPAGQGEAIARYDASDKPDGTVTEMDTGQAVTNFGSAPIAVSGGVLAHSPAAAPQQAGYIQLDLGARARRVGLTAAWEPGSTGAIAIVVPSAPWSQGVLPDAGIHLVMFGNGIWHCSRWNMGEEIYASYLTNGRYADVRDGVLRPIDLWIDPDTETCTLYFPDGSSTTFSSPFIASETAQWVVWELYETNGVADIPATMGELWADTYVPANWDVGLTAPAITQMLTEKAPTTLHEGGNSTGADIVASGSIPPGVAYLEAIIIGGSGGGGSGACVAAGTAGNGGAAGGSPGVWREMIPASALAGVSSWSVTVGRAGVGGAGRDTAGNGNAGTAGTLSRVTLGGMALTVFAGGGGVGGTTGATQGAATGAGGPFGAAGAAGGINGAVGNNGAGITATPGTAGSGSGGGVTAASVANNGGSGGSNLIRGFTGGTAGIAGGAAPGVGTNVLAAVITAPTAGSPGPGVGGGAGSATGAAQAGATPVGYGSGGGGGGASLVGNLSGAGGNGVGGYVLLRAHYF